MSVRPASGGRLVVVGDALLDRDVEGRSERLAPDAAVPVLDEAETWPRPGGAGLAAALAARQGPVTLVTALAADDAGRELARALLGAGVDLVGLSLRGRTPEKIRLLDGGRPLLRLDRGGEPGQIEGEGAAGALKAALAGAAAVLVSDYGRGVAADPEVRRALSRRRPTVPLVWDPHPRGPAPLAGAALVTPNLGEALRLGGEEVAADEPTAVAVGLARRWRAAAVAITRGELGAVLATPAGMEWTFACDAADGDACGAGDRFAIEAASVLATGGDAEAAVAAAVAAATTFVREGGASAASSSRKRPFAASAPPPADGASSLDIEPALALAERVRAEGGTVVATGGCFDLLHVGHARTLEAARALGDCLVVLLNSDRSVRRLKGADRPLVVEPERAAMLRALACVDAVVVFDEATPVEALRILRPDVWAKGGDYELDELPESEELGSWGGRTAILPYLPGRSTTTLIEEVGARAGA